MPEDTPDSSTRHGYFASQNLSMSVVNVRVEADAYCIFFTRF